MSMGESQTGNQEVLNAIMEQQFKRRGFKFRILPYQKFASGKYLPEVKSEGMEKRIDTYLVAHFCWTHNMEMKRQRMIEYKSKHLADECFNDVWKCKVDKLGTEAKTFIQDATKICPKL